MKYIDFFHKNYDVLLTIMNCLHIGVWITDAAGNVVMVNDVSAQDGGMTREQLLGRNMQELIDIGYLERSSALEAIASGKPETIVEELGTGGHCLTTSIPLFSDGELDMILCVERDISEIESLKSALQEQKSIADKLREQLLRADIDLSEDDQQIVTNNLQMIHLKHLCRRVGGLDVTVTITGESGTGKEMIADMIYSASPRKGKPFIKVNCAAIPESLIESELFGYEEGSFTGARAKGKRGVFEQADGGTLFLDEVGELTPAVQSDLLRVLESGEIRRIGSEGVKTVDVRLIAATNRNLKTAVAEGTFREDLYYRLMIMPVKIPPLRDRKEDLQPLALHFLQQANDRYHLHKSLSEGALAELQRYDWPGNVRELRNLIERLVVSEENEVITGFDVASTLHNFGDSLAHAQLSNADLPTLMKSYEEQVVRSAMERYGTMTAAAQHLGINKSTLSRKLQSYEN